MAGGVTGEASFGMSCTHTDYRQSARLDSIFDSPHAYILDVSPIIFNEIRSGHDHSQAAVSIEQLVAGEQKMPDMGT